MDNVVAKLGDNSNKILPNLNFPLPNETGPSCIVKVNVGYQTCSKAY